MKPDTQTSSTKAGWLVICLLAGVLALLFWRSFLPDYIHFSNDGPLGSLMSDAVQMPGQFTGIWRDLNSLGSNDGTATPMLSTLLLWVAGPVGFAKIFPAAALFFLGIGAWAFFRALKLSPLAAALGAVAAMLNTSFFAGACWGVAQAEIAMGFNFFALALIAANDGKTGWFVRWTRLALAGLCVGINVMEAADVGALCSIFIAGFAFYKSLVESDSPIAIKAGRGVGRVAVVGIFAGFIAFQTVTGLVGTEIEGVSGTAQDAQTKAAHWDFATQWSLPKVETLGIVVPGLFGYRMDTPQNMMPSLQDAYRDGVYWGGMGRTPEIDRYFDGGGKDSPPPGMMRFGYAGYYCGILVVLLAFWAVGQSLRRQNSPFSTAQKNFIWFWTAVLVISLPLAWGRFAPFSKTSNDLMFYALLYHLPYFSTIRNPAKFLVFFDWAMLVLFAYGVHALSRRCMEAGPAKPVLGKIPAKKLDAFDRKWIYACVGIFGASVIGWLIFAGEKPAFVQYLQNVGFGDADFARQIATFSLGQMEWFLIIFAIALGLFILALTGCFSGPRAKLGAVLLGAFLIFDLGRADLPFVIHWDYKQKYEVGSLNPVVNFLREKPYEHRVVGLPFRAPEGLGLLDQLYRIEWTQHLFLYYNIQSLDIVQMPRMPENLKEYLEALSPNGTPESVPLLARQWELTNTRYILGPAGYLDVLNQQLDPVQHRFRIAQRFEIAPKPGVLQPTQLSELTAVTNENGRYALFEFTGALPRAKLYSNWQVNTNDQAVLKTLANLKFDPAQTLLIDTPQKNLPAVSTNENSGTVEFKSYAPKHIVFAVNATTPSVLLLNDKYDPNWRVTVDGRPAELLRCNFIMRGVQVPPGAHTVTFDFSLPNKLLYVTVSAVGVGLCLLVGLVLARKREASNKP
jgi:hypothetical protein